MRRIALEYKVRVVDKEAVEYFDGWKNQVVRELAPMMPGATPGQIAKTCCNEITAAEVSKSLEFLTKAGFLKKGADGSYRQTEKNVAASKEGMAYAVHAMQHKMLQPADESIERFEPQDDTVPLSDLTKVCLKNALDSLDNLHEIKRSKAFGSAPCDNPRPLQFACADGSHSTTIEFYEKYGEYKDKIVKPLAEKMEVAVDSLFDHCMSLSD